MVFQYGKTLVVFFIGCHRPLLQFNSRRRCSWPSLSCCVDRVRGVAMEVQTPFRLYASFVHTLRRDATEVRRFVVPSRCGTPFRFVSCFCDATEVRRLVTQQRCVVVPFRRGAERRLSFCRR